MTFKDKEYAESVWTEDKIDYLEDAWAEQRERWYKLLDPLLPAGNQNVLDVGCGIGVYYELLKEKAEHYIGVDPTDGMVVRAKQLHPDGDFRFGMVYNLRFPNKRFDLVFCWSVLIHLPHDTIERALRELWRVTKERLFFNLYVTLDERSFSTVGPWGEYLTAMESWDIRNILESLGPVLGQRWNYEDVDLLDGRRFQRMIFLLERG